MHHIVQTLAILSSLAILGNASGEERFVDSRAEAINSLLKRTFADANAGMVVGLIDSQDARIFAYGVLDNDTGKEIDGDTLFEIGSISKVFTGLLMLDAATRQEVSIDTPVADYLPKGIRIPDRNGKSITLRNLACQESGLPWFPPSRAGLSFRDLKRASDSYSIIDLYADVQECELAHDPGAEFTYSNVGYSLLGRALELASGKDFPQLLEDRISGPLQLEDTMLELDQARVLRCARGHWEDGTRTDLNRFQANASAGGLFSTANDLLKFLGIVVGLEDTPLSPHLQQMYVTRHSTSRDFGKTAMPWYDSGVFNPSGSELWGHAGGTFGGLTFIGVDVKKQRGVVVLTNQTKVYPNPIGWTLLQEMPFTKANISYAVRQVIGVGIALGEGATGPRIIRVFPQSSAGEAKLKNGSVLLEIDGRSTSGMAIGDCLEMLEGAEGSKVQLTLQSTNEEKKTVELTRRAFLTSS